MAGLSYYAGLLCRLNTALILVGLWVITLIPEEVSGIDIKLKDPLNE